MSHLIAVQAPPAVAPAAGQSPRVRKATGATRSQEALPLLEEPDSTRRALRVAEAARQRTLAGQHAAAEEFAELLALAHLAFTDFCQTVCMVIRNRRARAVLDVEGKPPVDALAFVRTARFAYRAALQDPFAPVLAACGYDAAALNSALDHLELLAASRQALLKASSRGMEFELVYAASLSTNSQLRNQRGHSHRLGSHR